MNRMRTGHSGHNRTSNVTWSYNLHVTFCGRFALTLAFARYNNNNNNNNNFICTNIIYNTKIKTMQIKNKEHQGTKTTYGIL